jgi:hypothetical protein
MKVQDDRYDTAVPEDGGRLDLCCPRTILGCIVGLAGGSHQAGVDEGMGRE